LTGRSADITAVSPRTELRFAGASTQTRRVASLLLCGALAPALAPAQETEATSTLPAVSVVGATPLPGLDLPKDRVPAPVQTATGADIA
jgi:hypothetical protein